MVKERSSGGRRGESQPTATEATVNDAKDMAGALLLRSQKRYFIPEIYRDELDDEIELNEIRLNEIGLNENKMNE